MYPISRKQAAGAKKMKELQPKIAELKKKYAGDKEKMARAQMELFGKHNYNPMSGCLPMFLQLPIFIGLYQGLNNSVNLRLAPFLWFDNLAAPDALFNMPHLPNHAWPTYANYPNYAQVSYPKQYSASAWPYIGPFYPYPQIPLGWRQVQLEWDDGHWNLNFRPRTDRWWWFLDPKNW
jgi:YidC/Oxa1 family membrane protein insertase